MTVLLYHDILPPWERPNADTGCVPLQTFHDHVEALAGAGFEFIPLAAARESALRARPGRPLVAFTFDDGYAGLHPVLPDVADRLHPTVFLLSDYLGRSNLSWNTRAPVVRPHLTLAQVRELADAGVDLQAHGTDHHNLLKFTAEELRERFRRTIGWFREHLGYAPTEFAYPYGACSPLVESVAAEFFTGAVTVNHGVWTGPRARYALNRFSVPSYLDGDGLVEVIRADPAERWVEVERRAPWRK